MELLQWICAFALIVACAVFIGILGIVFIDVLFDHAKWVRSWIARFARWLSRRTARWA